MKQRVTICALALLMAWLLSGCFMRDPDELITLPKQAEDYYNLQQTIDKVMKNASYSAPISGENRQAVQLKDLDGDGVNEAVLFAKTDGEHPLKIYVFHRDGDVFPQIACLEGDGVNFDSVQFSQVDGVGGLEIVVSRQLNEGVPQTLSIYATQNNTVTELLNVSDYRFSVTDLNDDGAEDVFVLRTDAAQGDGIAELYTWQDSQMLSSSLTLPEATVENTVSVQTGKIEGSIPAIFVTGALDEATQSLDVFTFQGDRFQNLANSDHMLQIPVGWSLTDVDADGAMEIPQLLALPMAETSAETDGLSLVRWLGFAADGSSVAKSQNLHNNNEQWYFNLPEFWQVELRVATQISEDCHATVLYQQTSAGGELIAVLTIYAYSGEDKEQWSSEGGRILLGTRGNVTYAALIAEVPDMECLRQDAVMARFHLLPEQVTVVS